MKILVIDSRNVADEIIRICRDPLPGTDIQHAESGEAACEFGKEYRLDVVIISSRLPGMDCLRTYEALEKITPGVTGLILIGADELHVAAQAMNAGFSGFLTKPVEPHTLLKRLADAGRMKSLRDENIRLNTLLPLYLIGKQFLRAATDEKIYSELLDAVENCLGVSAATIMMLDAESGNLKIVAARGFGRKLFNEERVEPGKRISGWVFENATPVILNRKTQQQSPVAQFLERGEISASISFPLMGRDAVIGVINISHTSDRVEYSEADIELLSILANFAVMAIENVKSIRERETHIKLRTLLEQYVAPEVADLLLERDENYLDVGSVQELTVMFADIRHFTQLVQHLSPEKLRLFLNEFFALFTQAVYDNGGTLDKFMGDGALVIFGAPVKIEKPSETAAATALRIVREFNSLRDEWQKKYGFFKEIGLGIGISRGKMFVGNVGSRKRLDYTVIGADVNIAQRLASVTEGSNILITASVKADIGDSFPIVKTEKKQLKGLEKEIEVSTMMPL